MGTIKARLKRLEARRPGRPWVTLTQDMDNPAVYHLPERAGTVDAAELEELKKAFNLIVIRWADDWRTPAAGQDAISLTWGD